MGIDSQVCFHRGPFSSLLNHERAPQGLWSYWMAVIRMCVVPNCSQPLSRLKNQQCRTLAKYNYSSYTVNLAWLKSSTTELQHLEYFKSVFLVIIHVPLRTVFAETVTYNDILPNIIQLVMTNLSMFHK